MGGDGAFSAHCGGCRNTEEDGSIPLFDLSGCVHELTLRNTIAIKQKCTCVIKGVF